MPLGLDQETMRMLWETFSMELDDQIQVITDGLLVLERGLEVAEKQRVLEEVFRAAHNIKGAARGVEATDVSEIAHHLESIFSVLKRVNKNPDGAATDIALESMDVMRQASAALLEQKPLAFDIQGLISRLKSAVEDVATQSLTVEQSAKIKSPVSAQSAIENSGQPDTLCSSNSG